MDSSTLASTSPSRVKSRSQEAPRVSGTAETKRSHRCNAFWKSLICRTHCQQETGEVGRGVNGWSGLFSFLCLQGYSVEYTLYSSLDLAKVT